jgi:aromatic ring hydroxylase
MSMTGKEYLGSIRDGRRVYIGGELVEDVTVPQCGAILRHDLRTASATPRIAT